MYIDPNDAKEIETSITFLINEYNKSGHNPKPVIFHSLNVAFYLMSLGYDKKIIIPAVLHDLIEDSAVDKNLIEAKFNKEVAGFVDSVSHNSQIESHKDRYEEMFKRTTLHSKEATILKCADTYINSFYIKLVEDKNLKKELIEKIGYFLKLSKSIIGDEPVWIDLDKQYQVLR